MIRKVAHHRKGNGHKVCELDGCGTVIPADRVSPRTMYCSTDCASIAYRRRTAARKRNGEEAPDNGHGLGSQAHRNVFEALDQERGRFWCISCCDTFTTTDEVPATCPQGHLPGTRQEGAL